MKKKGLILVFFLNLSIGFTQSYESFFNKENIEYHLCMPTYTYITENDPVNINGITYRFYIYKEDTAYFHNLCYYKCMWNERGYASAYLREDTTCGKIYRYYPNIDTEYVWCDMSLNIGDTFCLPVINDQSYWYEEQNTKLLVDSIVYINEKKIIYLKANIWCTSIFENAKLRFIEGIGPTYGPMGFQPMILPELSFLSCVHKDDELVFIANADAGCDINYVNKEDKPFPKHISIHPNPAENVVFIQLSDNQEIGDITFCDISGRVIYHECLNIHTASIDISHWDNGIYVIMLNYDNKKHVYKFIKCG